jgi:phosphatidylglycerol:prolipoprotein diacylglycerol transferase
MPIYDHFILSFDPIAFEIGPFIIRWYALAYIAGIVLGWLYMRQLMKRSDLWQGNAAPMSVAQCDDFMTYATLGVILGGRLGYVLFYNFGYFWHNPLEIFAVWQGGMSFHGGFLGVVLAALIFARKHAIHFWHLFDALAVIAPIGLFFGRLANFINGELWGRMSDVAWAVIIPIAGNIPRHPSQLYQAVTEGFLLFTLCAVLVVCGGLKKKGFLSGVFLTGYGVSRFITEFYREPDVHIGLIADYFTMGQILSLPMIIIGIIVMMRAKHVHSVQKA